MPLRPLSPSPALSLALLCLVLTACTHQGGAPLFPLAGRGDATLIDAGRSVFRYETFGNERFFSDVLGLPDGVVRLGVTPNTLLAAGVQFDSDKLPSDFLRVDVGVGPYADALATQRLIEANAVMGVVARGDRVGVTCALCHSRADDRLADGVGRRLDGVPNTRLAVGEVIAWAERSRAYLPFANVSGHGRGPRVDLDAATSPQRIEEEVDAALRAWPRGQADAIPDGVGNPTEFPALFFLQEHGPYLWDGSFARAQDAHQFFAAMVLDPTALATRHGKGFLTDGPFAPVGAALGAAYQRVLADIAPETAWPRAVIFRASAFNLFHDALDPGFRVSRDEIRALAAYLGSVLPPPPEPVEPNVIDRGRRVFRRAGCNNCHLESAVAGGAVVALVTLVPGYRTAERERWNVIVEDPESGYDDRLVLAAGDDSMAARGFKVPSLLGLWLSAPYLHDGSAPTLDALLSPARGPGAPHPYTVPDADERAALEAFLRVWDGRTYP